MLTTRLHYTVIICSITSRDSLQPMNEIRFYPFGYMLSQIRLSVTFVHPTRPVVIFGNVSTPFCSLACADMQNFTDIVPGEPLHRELNAREVAKYSDIGHVEGYISETVQDTASGTIND